MLWLACRWIPACAGKGGPCHNRHSRESGNPVTTAVRNCDHRLYWIPACAGMTGWIGRRTCANDRMRDWHTRHSLLPMSPFRRLLRDGPSALLRMTPRRGWRAVRRSLFSVRDLLDRGRRLTARHMRRLWRRAPLQSRTACPGPTCQLLAGTRSGPGGAPAPPECFVCVTKPAGAAPRPTLTTPHDSAPQWTRWGHCSGRLGGGG